MKKGLIFKLLTPCIIAVAMQLNALPADAQIIGTSRTTQSVENDEKGPVNTLSRPTAESAMLTIGNIWNVRECCGWTGLWIRRPNTNTFDARWRHTNGSTATDVLQLSGWDRSTNVVTITRKSMNGFYKANYNPTARTLTNGSATWYTTGNSWSATIE